MLLPDPVGPLQIDVFNEERVECVDVPGDQRPLLLDLSLHLSVQMWSVNIRQYM